MVSKLDKDFFLKDTRKVAKELLGKFIVRKVGSKKIEGMIVETEAYHGFDDMASHAAKKKTPRNEVMYDEAGKAYVYLVYGMHYCFNVVTCKKDFPAAVLIRAVLVEGFDKKTTNGPAKFTKFFSIDKSLNKLDITKSSKLWIEDKGVKVSSKDIFSTERIGVSYAGQSAKLPWRFYIDYQMFLR